MRKNRNTLLRLQQHVCPKCWAYLEATASSIAKDNEPLFCPVCGEALPYLGMSIRMLWDRPPKAEREMFNFLESKWPGSGRAIAKVSSFLSLKLFNLIWPPGGETQR